VRIDRTGGRVGRRDRGGRSVADTGTIVVASGPQGAQDASLLPGAHVAVLSAQDIFPSLTDWLERGGRSLLAERSSVTLITGPSRTADIEMTLTIGVHGPARLIVLVCDSTPQTPGSPVHDKHHATPGLPNHRRPSPGSVRGAPPSRARRWRPTRTFYSIPRPACVAP
jgi:hypothetical protein